MRPPAARDLRLGSPRQHGCPILAPACPGGATDDGAIAQGATRHVGLRAHLLGNVPGAGRRHTVPRQVQASFFTRVATRHVTKLGVLLRPLATFSSNDSDKNSNFLFSKPIINFLHHGV